MLDANLGTAVLRTKLEASGLTSGLNQAEQQIRGFGDRSTASLDKLASGFTRVGQRLSLFVTAPVLGLGAAFIKAASDAEETASKFATVFRSIGDQAEDAADDLAASFGLSSTAARRLLGDTGDLLTGFGFTQEAALDVSTQVNELAVDLASFTNFAGGAEGASAALTKALLGETESLKSLGIAIRATDVEAKILELTQQGITFETENQAKAYATLAIAQEQSKNAIGDYERTSGSFANQLRLLRSNVNELAVSFGEVLLPIATKVVSGVSSIVGALADMPPAFRTGIVVVAGLAAAIGPLLVGLGQLLTAVQVIGPALVALRVAALPLLGPAGIILGAVGFVGALAYAFSGRGESLDTALGNVSAAAAGNSPSSVIGALETLKERVDQSAVPAIQRMIDKLVETGELSAELRGELADLVSGFSRTAAEAELASVRTRIAALEAQGLEAPREGGNTAEFLAARNERLANALNQAGFSGPGGAQVLRFELDESGAVTLRAYADAVRSSTGAPLVPSDRLVQQIVVDTLAAGRADQTNLLSPLLARQAELEAQLATAPAGGGGSGFGGGGGGTAGTAVVERTVRDVFADLDRKGSAAARLAAFEATPEAFVAGLETRIRAIDDTISELLTDFAGIVKPEELEFLRGRRDALREELSRATLDLERRVDPASDVASLAPLDAPLTAAQRTLELELGRLINAPDLGALLAPRVDTANREIAAISDEIDLGPLGSAARREQDRLRLLIEQSDLTGLLFPTLERDLDLARRIAASSGESFVGDPALARDATASFDAAGAALRGLADRSEILEDTVRALVAAGAPAEELDAAFEALLEVSGALPEELVETYLALQGLLAVAAEGGDAIRRSGNRITGPLAPSPFRDGAPSVPGTDQKGATIGAIQLGFDVAAIAQTTNEGIAEGLAEITEAGVAFRQNVAIAGAQFAAGLVQSIRSGDVGGAISSAFSAAGQVASAGASFLGSGGASFLGLGASAIPGLGLFAGLVPILGGLLGGLFGGNRGATPTESEREAEATRRSRQTPSFVVRISVAQTNNYGGTNADAAVRADNDRRTRQVVADVLREIDFPGLRRAALGSPL